MTTEDDFQRHLDAHPDDHHTRLVFADWLQDRGDPRAEGYRALGVWNKFPMLAGQSPLKLHEGCWFWTHSSDNPCTTLPVDWWYLWRQRIEKSFSPQNTRRLVEDAAALAFAELPEDRRRELLAGKVAAA